MTTELGTAKSEAISVIESRYDADPGTLTALFKKLDELYLVARTDNGEKEYRLSHDTLAPIVRKMYANSNPSGPMATQLLAGKNISGSNPFGESDIKILKAGKGGMRKWKDQETKAFNDSQHSLNVSKRNTGLLQWGIASSILIAFGVLVYSLRQSQKNLLVSQLMALAEQIDDKTLAVQAADKAWNIDPGNATAARLLRDNLNQTYYRKEMVFGYEVADIDI